ncbi:MAG: hypothetical protein U9Q81_09550, partial [Pseudomonadota bacterium]|nr:hypothetical protein [Pseudomonadota bacterium]
AVLDGFRLRSDAEVFRHPDRYMDERGRQMWQAVTRIIEKTDGDKPGRCRPGDLGTRATLPVRSRPPVLSIIYSRSQ